MDISDIIILIAAIGISLFTSIAKKIKANREQANRKIEIKNVDETGWEEYKPLSEIFANEHNNDAEDLDMERREVYYPSDTITKQVPNTGRGNASRKSGNKLPTNPETSAGNIVEVDPMPEFDLRTAVIYSEILKPKFNE